MLAGPSGCGKSRLAEESGLPILALDDFYRDGTEPDMPREPTGVVDWEDPRAWNATAAVTALERLCRDGSVTVPVYSFAADRAVGERRIDRGDAPVVIAEGIFAAEIIAELAERGLLADALLLRRNRWVTFGRRLARDLRDGRKERRRLLALGWEKTRSEPLVMERQRLLGARPVGKTTAVRRLEALCEGVAVFDGSSGR